MQTPEVQKVLIIGFGHIVIGQAAEFGYAGSQACRALREDGVTTISPPWTRRELRRRACSTGLAHIVCEPVMTTCWGGRKADAAAGVSRNALAGEFVVPKERDRLPQ